MSTEVARPSYWDREIGSRGYRARRINGRRVNVHVAIAEAALGKPLPTGAVVHHFNGIKSDNRNANLVICNDATYHALLHRRTKAYDACGHADWRKCPFCRQYDAQERMKENALSRYFYHVACKKADDKRRNSNG